MINEASILIPMSREQEAAEDEMLASLSQLAYSSPNTDVKVRKRKRRSRFFFRLSKSFAAETKSRKAKFVPQQMEHIDGEVERRLTKYKGELPPELAHNIDAVREFFLSKIGPLSLATSAGSMQAKEVVQRMLKTDVDSTQFEKFERMSQVAVNLMMARFIASYYGLPQKAVTQIIEGITPRQPALIPVPTASLDRTPRHERNAQTKEQRRAEEGQEGKAAP